MYDIDVTEVATVIKDCSTSIEPIQQIHSRTIQGHRIPKIKFIGKRQHKQRVAVISSPISKPFTAVDVASVKKHHPASVDFYCLKEKAWFGRPTIGAKEMAAIESGGAL
jgi:hypothetical protein